MDDLRGAARHRRRPGPAVWIGLALLVFAGSLVLFYSREPASSAERGAPQPPATAAPVGGLATRQPGPLAPEGAAVAAALRAGDHEALEMLFLALAEREAGDSEAGEVPARRAAAGLASSDSALEPLLIEWRSARPRSAVAQLALATHYNERAWAARGARYARDTPAAAFEEYRAWRAKAQPLARSAVELEPRLVEGWVLLVNLALGDPGRCLEVAREGLAEAPASWRIRSALMNCLRPRWGGRYEMMAGVAQEAERHASRNHRLLWLSGYVAEDRADLAANADDLAGAERWMAEAVAVAAEAPVVLEERARLLRSQGRWSEALEVLDRGLELWGDDPDLLDVRVAVLFDLGRDAEARAAVERIAAIDPVARGLDRWRRRLAQAAVQSCAALARSRALEEAIDRCLEAARSDPADVDSRYWLGRSYLQARRYPEAKSSFHEALEIEPRHRESIVNLDWLYGREEQWGRVLELWDAYLVLEPQDARGWLERAGTRRRLGQMREACGDLRRACELGNDEACGHQRRDC